MFGFTSRTILLAVLVASVLGVPVPQAQNLPAANQQGQPLSVGQAADRNAQASGIFGTTTDAPNFKDSPTGVCIVPAFASDAGFGTAKVPLTTEQALQLCPKAARIVVQAQNGKRAPQGAGQNGNAGQSKGQTNTQPAGAGNSQPAASTSNQQGNDQANPQTGSGSGASQQGQPISVGKAANPTGQASTVFGTTTESPNFSTSPTGVCIVPMFANEAGLGSDRTPLTNEQALQLCPNAARIVVCTN